MNVRRNFGYRTLARTSHRVARRLDTEASNTCYNSLAVSKDALRALLEGPSVKRRIGPFPLQRQLGEGGFAPVWLAKEVYGETEIRTAAVKLFALPGASSRAFGSSGSGGREQQVVEEMTNWDDIVLATGGGVIMRSENRQALGARGFVVYLYASVEEQVRRTRRDRRRPLLQKGNPEEVLRSLMAVRDPLYREIADYIIETDGCSPRTVAQRLVRDLQ